MSQIPDRNNFIVTTNSPIRMQIMKVNFLSDIRMNKSSYFVALPAILYTFLFGYLTYPYLIIAFQRFDYRKGLFSNQWIGLENFKFFFKSSDAFTVTWNTIKLNFLFIFFGTLFSFALALVLNELRSKWFLRINQSIMLFPYYLSWVVVSYMLYGLFSMELGIVNRVLKYIGVTAVNWYATATPWPIILTVMRVWKGSGIGAIIYLAAIASIDEQLYDAAKIDGATRWQQCKAITIPLLMPTMIILTLLSIGKIMYGDFGMIYALIDDNGVLYPTTDVIDTYIFRYLRKLGDPSEAMAIGLFQSAIGFIMVFGSNWIARVYYEQGALY